METNILTRGTHIQEDVKMKGEIKVMCLKASKPKNAKDFPKHQRWERGVVQIESPSLRRDKPC